MELPSLVGVCYRRAVDASNASRYTELVVRVGEHSSGKQFPIQGRTRAKLAARKPLNLISDSGCVIVRQYRGTRVCIWE